ncbi:MAG: hypothetical protein KGM49_05485 [Sphingomonadales bacterium]|nr:hypothetical protein [Sphingomonadales bacterium]
MDTYRGNFIDRSDEGSDWPGVDFGDDEAVREPPPGPVGQDERRMQVRAYNHWASLLDNRNFPSIEELEPDALPDFGPYSVLLDFTRGIANPAVRFLGDKLAAECGAGDGIETLDDVPSRSLLSRITDHYMQILANQAPIGFEAEFVNQREQTILYRGILLPFSSDDDTIDFIYGVINWKELADQKTADALLAEIDRALDPHAPTESRNDGPLTDWADGPQGVNEQSDPAEDEIAPVASDSDDDVLDLGDFAEPEAAASSLDMPAPSFAVGGWASILANEDSTDEEDGVPPPARPIDFTTFESDEFASPAVFDAASDDADMGLADWLASARELADAARGSEDRTRTALYAAIGRAYDFSLAAADAPEDFAELVADSGLTMQDRAPMTPVVKLVFGADYDKTRLTEYASALSHGHRLGVARGELGKFLAEASGGLKAVVSAERQLKRDESGKADVARETPREALARKLRKLDPVALEDLPADGAEFTVLVARRLPDGTLALLGEVGDDVALLERAARRLVG